MSMSIYGDNIFGKTSIEESTNSIFNFGSIAYNEYLNYKSMLENCTNDSDRMILEAKTEILCEIGIKDIWEKIKEAFKKLAQMIKDLFEKIKSFFKSKKVKKLEADVNDLQSKIEEKERVNQKLANELVASNSELYSTRDDYISIKGAFERLEIKHDVYQRDFSKRYEALKQEYANLEEVNDENLKKINLSNIRIAKTIADLANNEIIYFDVFDYTTGNSPAVYHIGKAAGSIFTDLKSLSRTLRDKSNDNEYGEYTEYKAKSDFIDKDRTRIENLLHELNDDTQFEILSKEVLDKCKGVSPRLALGKIISEKNAELCNKYCNEFANDPSKFLQFLKNAKYAAQGSMMEHTVSDLNKATDKINSMIIALSNNVDTISADIIKALSKIKDFLLSDIEISKILCSHATRCYGALGSSIVTLKALLNIESD